MISEIIIEERWNFRNFVCLFTWRRWNSEFWFACSLGADGISEVCFRSKGNDGGYDSYITQV